MSLKKVDFQNLNIGAPIFNFLKKEAIKLVGVLKSINQHYTNNNKFDKPNRYVSIKKDLTKQINDYIKKNKINYSEEQLKFINDNINALEKMNKDNYNLFKKYYNQQINKYNKLNNTVNRIKNKKLPYFSTLAFLSYTKWLKEKRENIIPKVIEVEEEVDNKIIINTFKINKTYNRNMNTLLNITDKTDYDNKDKTYKGLVSFQINFQISEEVVNRTKYITFTNETNIETIIEEIKNSSANYIENIVGEVVKHKINYKFNGISNDIKLINQKYNPITREAIDFSKFKFADDSLLENKYIKLKYPISANSALIQNNCVYDTLIPYLKKYRAVKKFNNFCIKNNINKDTNWTSTLLVDCLNLCKISYELYSQFGKLLSTNKYNSIGHLYFIVANNHIYRIDKLEKKLVLEYFNDKIDITNIKYIDSNNIKYFYENNQIKKIDIDFYHKKDYIKKVAITNEINSKQCTLYVNKYYFDCYNLYKDIDITVLLSYKFNDLYPLKSLCKKHKLFSSFTSKWNRPKPINISINNENLEIIQKLDNRIDYTNLSFEEFTKEYLNYEKEEINNLVTLDLNKAYTSMLLELDDIPIINSRCIEKEYNGEEIVKNNFYIIEEVDELINNIISVGYCSGYRLNDELIKYCKIVKVIEPKLYPNPFKKLIRSMLNKDELLTKTIINKFIGTCQIYERKEEEQLCEVEHIFNNVNESELYSGNVIERDGLYFGIKTTNLNKKTTNSNMLPLSIYIIDKCVNKMLELVETLNKENNIKKIVSFKTDALTYIGKEPTSFKLGNEVGGFKKIESKVPNNIICNSINNNNINYNLVDITEFDLEMNILGNCSAGCGKTYYIKNVIIPKLLENKKSFFVCCSQWMPIITYDCDKTTLQSLIQTNKIKNKHISQYDYIIIDEAGLLTFDHWDYIYNNRRVGQYIIAFGDMNQLPPVDPENNNYDNCIPLQNLSVKQIFDYNIILNNNYRNNYKLEDYENMRNGTYIETEYELKLYNLINFRNICYTNDYKDNLNKYKSKDFNDSIGKLKVKKGCPIICKTNNFKNKQIYNKQLFILENYDDINVELRAEESNNIYIIKIQNENSELNFDKNFDLAYALTLYCVQGMSIPYNKLGFHEVDYIKKHVKNGLYVMYSRIQQ